MSNPRTGVASVGVLLLAIAALLGSLGLYLVAQFVVTTAQAKHTAALATVARASEPNDGEKEPTKAKAMVAKLKEKNLFIPPQPKTNPVQGVEGILGNEALINGKWYKTGDKVGDAEVLAITATSVKVSWNGQETELTPNGSDSGGPPSGRPMASRPPRPGRPERIAPGQRPTGLPSGPPPGMNMPMELRGRMSPEDMERLREQMREQAAVRIR